MPYEFDEWEEDPQPQASSARSLGPPRKFTGIGVLDPPSPPSYPIGPVAALPTRFWIRLIAGVAIAVLIGSILFIFFSR
ncbi:MAG TPA: hypothetical protein VJN93_09665 [Candidatus Acidoferrum sp.]|nr:hypothetical protein [Candidatus Acidoferrum sp.]